MGFRQRLRRVGERLHALVARPKEPLGTPTCITIHHTASNKPAWLIGAMHRALRGYSGIGYHYVIGRGGLWTRDGKVYRGRPENVKGAHVATQNTGNIGIALIGNFERVPPTPKQLSVLEDMVVKLVQEKGIPVDRIVGHHGLNEGTVCPGRNFDLAAFRERVRRRLQEPAGTPQ